MWWVGVWGKRGRVRSMEGISWTRGERLQRTESQTWPFAQGPHPTITHREKETVRMDIYWGTAGGQML